MATSLIYFGDSVKALDDKGRVGGYLVRFTTDADPDLTGDFFTKSTDFDIEDGAIKSVYYAHGQDKKIGKQKIGRATVKSDELGLWVEAQLNLSDEYQKAIYELAKAEKLGWSSGSVSHLVERKEVGGASEITRWPLAEASLTPQPAEPRNRAQAIKSLIEDLEGDQPQAGRSLDQHSEALLAIAKDYKTRAHGLKELREQDGRKLSDKARQLIADTAAALKEITYELDELTQVTPEVASADTANSLYAEFLELSFLSVSE